MPAYDPLRTLGKLDTIILMRATLRIRRERRRLRRKFIKTVSTRSYHTFDKWLGFEYWKAGAPLWMALIITSVEGWPPLNPVILVALAVTLPWWIFITSVILPIYARWGDKFYMSITRHKLSKEYRR